MVDKYPDFWHVLVGNGSLGSFLGYIVIAFICADVSLLIEASNRDIASKATPVKFSWSFLVAANIPRLIANFLCIPILIRLIYQYVAPDYMLFLSIGVGFAVDRLGMLLKNIGVLTSSKIAAQIADKLSPTDPTITPKQ